MNEGQGSKKKEFRPGDWNKFDGKKSEVLSHVILGICYFLALLRMSGQA